MRHVMNFNVRYIPGGLYVPRYDINCPGRVWEASMCHVMNLTVLRGGGGLYVPRYDCPERRRRPLWATL